MKIRNILLPATIIAMLATTGCSLFGGDINKSLRVANNNFDYLDEESIERTVHQPEGTDPLFFSNKYNLPNRILDSRAALIGKAVDVRPPQKLMTYADNIVGYQDGDLALVWFFPDDNGRAVTTNEAFQAILRLFKKYGMTVDSLDPGEGKIQSDWIELTDNGELYTINKLKDELLRYRQRYSFTLGVNKENVPGVKIQITDNVIERSDGTELADGLNRFEPARYTAQMANKLMWSYNYDLKTRQMNEQPGNVEIYLGRDNNSLPCWIVSASFDDTYKALESIFLTYDIEIDTYSSTKGEILVSYDEFDPEFFEEHSYEPWGVESGDYLFKLGVFEGKTSISLYGKNGQPLEPAITVRMYSGFAQALNEQFLKIKSTNSLKNEVK